MKKFLLNWLIALMVMPGLLYAQALPISSTQNAITALIKGKASKRGFAANDPRYAVTLQQAGTVIVGSAAAAAVVTAAGVTAPAWLTAAVVMGLGSLFSMGISLAVDQVGDWMFNADGSISRRPNPGGAADANTAYVPKDAAMRASCTNVMAWNHCNNGSGALEIPVCLATGQANPTNSCRQSGENPTPATSIAEAMQRSGFVQAPGPFAPAESPSVAIATLTEQQKSAPVNPEVLAAVANQAWKLAAEKPGYEGLPHDPSDPITTAEVNAYRQNNPAAYPTVGDVVTPQPAQQGAESPFALPEGGTVTNPDNPPSGENGGNDGSDGPSLDWSVNDPGESVPKTAVEATYVPTVFASATGCPAPVSFEMMGKTYNVAYSPFCDLMATVAPLFLALGAAAASLIFVKGFKP